MSHVFHRSTSQHRPTPPPPPPWGLGSIQRWHNTKKHTPHSAMAGPTAKQPAARQWGWHVQPRSIVPRRAPISIARPSHRTHTLARHAVHWTSRRPQQPRTGQALRGHRTAARMPGGCHGNAAARQSARLGDAGSRTDGSEGIKSSRRAAAGALCCCWGSISASSFTVS